jgi:hypothetical protein
MRRAGLNGGAAVRDLVVGDASWQAGRCRLVWLAVQKVAFP